ncbi:MAG: RHS repeat-associated core domain-containing protein, partial [Desulfobacterales bacterium]|nr:RHS repeat-associated core domain-containing protein [Desulfobacterales bacterium]
LEKKTDASGDTLYDYSSRGELLSVTLPDSTVIEYVHDPYGRRIAKKKNGTVVEKYLWQGRTRLLAVYDKDDRLLMRFEYADGRMPVSMLTDNDSVYYLSYDQVGSLRIVTDISGKTVKKLDYDSFGNVYYDSDPAFEIPFGFAGGLHDRDTGLVRFGYRDYDPDAGRWTAKDPILFVGRDTDLYGYAFNNPVNYTDSNGLAPIGPDGNTAAGHFDETGSWIPDPSYNFSHLIPLPIFELSDVFEYSLALILPEIMFPIIMGSSIKACGIKKAVNSNLPHAVKRAVERGIFKSADEATDALKQLSKSITENGLPAGAILDSAHLDRVLIPIGNSGMAVYQIAKNGTAKLKTVLIAK